MYSCASCHTSVVVIGESIVRACRCDASTPVTASLTATVRGRGGFRAEPAPPPSVSAAVRAWAREMIRRLAGQ